MALEPIGVTTVVYGDGPFVEVGDPWAVVVGPRLIVVGGDLGYPQWSGRDVTSRSDRIGWEPIGFYDENLTCFRVLTSSWPVNDIAIHPSGRLVAIATGGYDGGYAFEGERVCPEFD